MPLFTTVFIANDRCLTHIRSQVVASPELSLTTRSGTNCLKSLDANGWPKRPSACGLIRATSAYNSSVASIKRRWRQALASNQPGTALTHHNIHALKHIMVRCGESRGSPSVEGVIVFVMVGFVPRPSGGEINHLS